MGQIRDGFLRIRGRLFPVIFALPIELEEGRFAAAAFLETLGSIVVNNMDLAFDVEESIDPDESLHYLLIHQRQHVAQYNGLILKPTGLKKGQFRRVGRFVKFPTEAEFESPDTDVVNTTTFGSQDISLTSIPTEVYSDAKHAFNWPPPSVPDINPKRPESWFEYESYDGVDDKGQHQYTIEII